MDKYNSEKIKAKQDVTPVECEQVFFNLPIIVGDDEKHSETKTGSIYWANDSGRLLFLVFTVRKGKLRVISARAMNKKERRSTKPMKKKTPQFRNDDEERDSGKTTIQRNTLTGRKRKD